MTQTIDTIETVDPERAGDPAELAAAWLADFGRALADGDADAAAELFLSDGWWRDNLSITWDIRSQRGRDQIRRVLAEHADAAARITGLAITEGKAPRIIVADDTFRWVEAFFEFETPEAISRGVLRLREDETGDWKGWTVLTAMRELVGHEEHTTTWDQVARPEYNAPRLGRRRWSESREDAREFVATEPTVLVVGAGQSGLGVAARLGRLGISALVVDRNPRVGDNWRNRYAILKLHDPFYTDHLPYLAFPDNWPLLTPKDRLADWLELYATAMDLNVWTSTEVADGSFDDATGTWTVRVRRADGELRTVRPKHVIVATGHSGVPAIPEFEGMRDFTGEILHSSQFQDGRKYTGRRAVVVGTGSSGHDIAQDLCEQGADTTIVQRSSTYVMSTENGLPTLHNSVVLQFAPDGPPTEDADLLAAAFPFPLAMELSQGSNKALAEGPDRELIEGLERAGFKTNTRGMLTAGISDERGGCYIDQGACQLIIDGAIKLKHGSVEGFTANHVVFADGSTLEADLVVLATGFKNMTENARALFGDAVADRCTRVWGIDEERNELRSVYRDSGHPNLWFHGGALAMCRYYSLLLALQIKAIEEGLIAHPSAL